jgi:hypothetical protein
MVKWNPATKVFDGVYLSSKKTSNTGWMVHAWKKAHKTSYGLTRLCCTASCKPIRDRFSSSRTRMLNGKDPAFFWTSEKIAREFFIFS